MIRLQFDGNSRSEAVDFCSRAVERLKEYLPVGTQEPSAPPTVTQSAATGLEKQVCLAKA